MICVIQVADKYVKRGSEVADVRYTASKLEARTFASIESARRTVSFFNLSDAKIIYKWEL